MAEKRAVDSHLNWIPYLTRKGPKAFDMNIWVGGRLWKGMTDVYATLLYFINHFSSPSPMMHHTNQHVLLKNCNIWLKSFFIAAFRCSCPAEVGCVCLGLCAGIRHGVQIWIVSSGKDPAGYPQRYMMTHKQREKTKARYAATRNLQLCAKLQIWLSGITSRMKIMCNKWEEKIDNPLLEARSRSRSGRSLYV